MPDGTLLFAGAEAAVQDALMAALRAHPDVQSVFGATPRVFDDETEAPAFPFARLERHEVRPAGAACAEAHEHVFTLTTESRHGGRREARDAIGALRAAVEAADLQPAGQSVVFAYATYGDVFRTNDRRAFRGILRVRVITEGA